MLRTRSLAATALIIAAASLTVAGCGSSSDSGDNGAATTAPTTTAPAAATTIAVTMGAPNEFDLAATPATVPAGPATIDVANKGKILHEMVVVPGSSAAEITDPSGEANEDGALGEVPDVAAGASGTLSIDLPAGSYILLCNLPGHFAGGMYTTLTVN